MSISLLDMGKTKKRNVRETIISVLSETYPLSIKKIYNQVKAEPGLDVTYQAVFKLIKEMTEDNILEKKDSEYKLNIGWIKQLEHELSHIKKNYLADSKNQTESYHRDINEYVMKLGPKIKEYIGKDPACIIGISGGGKLFGIALWKYLLREGTNASFIEYNTFEESSKDEMGFSKKDVEGKKVILVDIAVHSGATYKAAMNKISKYRNKFKMKDLKFAVYRDLSGLADFSEIKMG